MNHYDSHRIASMDLQGLANVWFGVVSSVIQ